MSGTTRRSYHFDLELNRDNEDHNSFSPVSQFERHHRKRHKKDNIIHKNYNSSSSSNKKKHHHVKNFDDNILPGTIGNSLSFRIPILPAATHTEEGFNVTNSSNSSLDDNISYYYSPPPFELIPSSSSSPASTNTKVNVNSTFGPGHEKILHLVLTIVVSCSAVIFVLVVALMLYVVASAKQSNIAEKKRREKEMEDDDVFSTQPHVTAAALTQAVNSLSSPFAYNQYARRKSYIHPVIRFTSADSEEDIKTKNNSNNNDDSV